MSHILLCTPPHSLNSGTQTNDLAQYKKISEKLQEIQKRVAEQQQTVDTLERAVRVGIPTMRGHSEGIDTTAGRKEIQNFRNARRG